MSRIRFIGQPFGEQLGATLRAALSNPETRKLWIATAWGKGSGLTRIGDAIKALRERPDAETEIVLGVDESGATTEGLRYAFELFDRAYVFHDSGNRTFHPKIYVAEGAYGATVLVGSGNLTKGGLFTNYEAAVQVEISADEEDSSGRIFLGQIRDYYQRLISAGQACQLITEQSLAMLLSDPSLRIASEAQRNQERREERRRAESPVTSIFGPALRGLSGAPSPVLTPVEADEEDTDSAPAQAESEEEAQTHEPGVAEPGIEDESPVGASGVTGFWKTLSNFDASLTSAPGQMIIPRRFLDFFPPMSVEEDKTASGGSRQSAVRFGVVFRDGETELAVPDARAILYEPAANHPRPNVELRFTFRSREVLEHLHAGDVLVFRRDPGGGIIVERREPGSMGTTRFGPV